MTQKKGSENGTEEKGRKVFLKYLEIKKGQETSTLKALSIIHVLHIKFSS